MQMLVKLTNGNTAIIDTVNHDEVFLPKGMLQKASSSHLATDSLHDREIVKHGRVVETQRMSKAQKEKFNNGFSYAETKGSKEWESNNVFNEKGFSDKYVTAKVVTMKGKPHNGSFQVMRKNKIAVHKEGPLKGKYVEIEGKFSLKKTHNL